MLRSLRCFITHSGTIWGVKKSLELWWCWNKIPALLQAAFTASPVTDCEHVAFAEAAADLEKIIFPDTSFTLSASQGKMGLVELEDILPGNFKGWLEERNPPWWMEDHPFCPSSTRKSLYPEIIGAFHGCRAYQYTQSV